MSILSKAYFHDESAAIKHLESILWADGIICPKCGVIGNAYELKGKTTRIGLRKCGACRSQFTVKVGTVFESSHIPLYKWLQATYLISSSKKGVSAHQLHRTLEITYKSAWFMLHRIREAMKDGSGKLDGIVEVDETYAGGKATKRGRGAGRPQVMALVERGGRIKAMVNNDTIKSVVFEHVEKGSHVMTDGYRTYKNLAAEGYTHSTVNHSEGKFVKGNAHTNTAEGFFGIFKRGIVGIYHHISAQHVDKYLTEFTFRWNRRMVNDLQRADMLLAGVVGKRLMYREPVLPSPLTSC